MKKLVSWSSGRLGNLMFCVASGKYYADKHGYDYYLLNNDGHDNFLNSVSKEIFKDIKIVDKIDETEYETIKERFTYDPIIVKTHKDVFLSGYRECPKYWENNKDFIFNLFKPEEGIIDALKKAYGVNFLDYVCINVRRGDYEKPDVKRRLGLLKVDFFYKCIKKFPESQKFLIVSDDIAWCRKHFTGSKYLFADKEVKGYKKMYLDLWIQTLCAHNIISNSTFSWWGAYLNKNKGRKVYYPYRFFKITPDRNKIPQGDNWIEVPAIWDVSTQGKKK